jgi:hypothetical protein
MHRRLDLLDGKPHAIQNAGGNGITLAHQSEKQMFRTHIILAQPPRLFLSEENYATCALCESLPHGQISRYLLAYKLG